MQGQGAPFKVKLYGQIVQLLSEQAKPYPTSADVVAQLVKSDVGYSLQSL